MTQPADNYIKRIGHGVKRLGTPITLTRGGGSVSISPILLPSVIQVVDTGSGTEIRQQAALSNSFAASGASPAGSSTSASSATSAYQTLTLLQDPAQNVPAAADTFPFDGVTWTVQNVSFVYVQAERVAIVSTATGNAIS